MQSMTLHLKSLLAPQILISLQRASIQCLYFTYPNLNKYCYKFSVQLNNFRVNTINDTTVLISGVKKSNDKFSIFVWDLKNDNKSQTQIDMKYSSSNLEIFVFQQSQSVCAIQKVPEKKENNQIQSMVWIQPKTQKFILQIYKLRTKKVITFTLLPSDNKLVLTQENSLEFTLNQNQKNTRAQFKKLNNRSKLAIINLKQIQKKIEFKVLDLQRFSNQYDVRTQMQTFSFSHNIICSPLCEVLLNQLWQISQNSLYLKLQTQVSVDRFMQFQHLFTDFKAVQKQIHFIWNYKEGKIRRLTINDSNSSTPQYFKVQFLCQVRQLTTTKTFRKGSPYYHFRNAEIVASYQQLYENLQLPVFISFHESDREYIVGKIQTNAIKSDAVFFNEIQIKTNYIRNHKIYLTHFQVDNKLLTRTMGTAFIMTQLVKNIDDDLLAHSLELIYMQ